jgi:hypothetical protein
MADGSARAVSRSRWRTVLLGFASLLLLAGCAGKSPPASPAASAQGPFAPLGKPPFSWPEAPETTGQPPTRTVATLSFGWPDSLRASVTRRYSVSRWLENKPTTVKSGYLYVVTAAPAPEGLRIGQSDLTIEAGSEVTDRVRNAYNKSLAELGSVYFPAYLVSREGRFLRLENVAQLRADLKGLIEMSHNTDGAANPAQALEQLQQMSDESLGSRVSFEWMAQVGGWTGVTLTSGVPAKVTFQNTGTVANGAPPIVYAGTALLVGRVPCEPERAQADCVALEMQVRGDPAQLKANAKLTVRANGIDQSKLPETALDSISSEVTVRIVAEPYGLVPHHAQIVGRTEMSFKVLNVTVPLRIEDELVLSYRYTWI